MSAAALVPLLRIEDMPAFVFGGIFPRLPVSEEGEHSGQSASLSVSHTLSTCRCVFPGSREDMAEGRSNFSPEAKGRPPGPSDRSAGGTGFFSTITPHTPHSPCSPPFSHYPCAEVLRRPNEVHGHVTQAAKISRALVTHCVAENDADRLKGEACSCDRAPRS